MGVLQSALDAVVGERNVVSVSGNAAVRSVLRRLPNGVGDTACRWWHRLHNAYQASRRDTSMLLSQLLLLLPQASGCGAVQDTTLQCRQSGVF
jgi:hypothetical protein